MPTMDDEDAQTRGKIARLMLRSALCRARRLRVGLSRPRRRRLVKDARAVKSLMAEAQAAGLAPMDERGGGARQRPARPCRPGSRE